MVVRIGFIGAGSIARVHAGIVAKQADADVTAVMDTDSGRAKTFSESTGAVVCEANKELFRLVDGLYVTTPPGVRCQVISEIIRANVPIFCEKPLAATTEDAYRIAGLVDDVGVPFMMGFSRRFYEPVNALKDIVAERIGKMLHVQSTRVGRGAPQKGNWRTDPAQMCGMTVESVSHDIDILRYVCGEIESARGETLGSRPDVTGFDDNMCAALRFENGAIGSLQVSWSSPLSFNHRLILGTGGSVLAKGPDMWAITSIVVSDQNGQQEELKYAESAGGDRGRTAQSEAFLAVVRGERAAPVDVHDGVATVRVSGEILSSSTTPLHSWAG